MFKALLAHYYRTTYKRLLRKLVTGAVIYADETEVNLKLGKGYVWVVASLEEVVYIYKPTREGDFLKDLLKDFRGVLVSDFYGAYDSIDCLQQKCLIHLMRDMNQELLDNPFDEELKSLTAPFGALLREIIVTTDRHGLKKRFLGRHKKNVAKYLQFVEAQSFRSEAAEALRARLLKYRHKLFTFLDHDGVSWNNNSAEHAIKRFACYRKDIEGSIEEPGLQDYLALLSICHTCHMRGLSFLQFLLSGHRNLELFRKRRRKRQRLAVEVYPTGFMPPRLAGLEKLRGRTKLRSGTQAEPGADPRCGQV
jgi:hypothetical protein